MFNNQNEHTENQKPAGSRPQAESIGAPSSSPSQQITGSPSHPSRRASVLILVVALLVLMALIGTAYISSTRIERYTSVQNSANTQIDLLVEGVKNLVVADVVGKIYDSSTTGSAAFRHPEDALSTHSYLNYDSAQDLYLASRVPEINTNLLTPTWPAFSWPLLTSADGSYTFVSPADKGSGIAAAGKTSIIAIPTSKTIGSKQSPGLVYYTPTGSILMGDGTTSLAGPAYLSNSGGGWIPAAPAPPLASINFLAADADGDGIADSPLWQLPIGPVNGITYYAAVRVIDQSSAVNASTAWSNLFDADASYTYTAPVGTAPPSGGVTTYMGLFRSNVGLRELLDSNAPADPDGEMKKLNNFRFNSPGTPVASLPPVPDIVTPATTTTARLDFNFVTQGDAFENQMVRRLANPGYNTTTTKYQSFPTETSTALAHQFCIRSTSFIPTELENDLFVELQSLSPPSPYSPSQVGNTTVTSTWFGSNFDYANGSASPPPMPLRPLIVTSNPVSNAVAAHYTSKGPWAASLNPYHMGDWVSIPNGANPGYCFVCIQDHTPTAVNEPTAAMATETWTVPAAHAANDAFWAYIPWTTTPTKASANTAGFGALMAAYWNVFWDHPSDVAPNAFPQPAFGYPFIASNTTYSPNQQANQNIDPASVTAYPARMFRSPIRDPNNASATYTPPTNPVPANIQYMTPGQVMMLRSALAALNTVSMRSASGSANAPPTGLDAVISRQITIPQDPGDAASRSYNVMLFGATKQPYISEVYVEIDPANQISALAIELSNPFPNAMSLDNWQVAWTNRSTPAAYSTAGVPAMVLANGLPIPPGTTIPPATATGPGKLLITANNPSGGAWPGASASVSVVAMNALAGAGGPISAEIIVMRPRGTGATNLPAAVGPGNIDPVNSYNEGTTAAPNFVDLVPVDQIDMGGLVPNTAGQAYDYRRATITASAAWNFVYPGAYSFVPGVCPFRHAGIQTVATGAPAVAGLGADKGLIGDVINPPATYQTYPMQVASTDSAGWNQATAAANSFPFGGFARNGDLLQVPFVGAYRILLSTAVGPFTAITPVVEINSLPMDSAFADDQDTSDDMLPTEAGAATPPTVFREQIGRFCPVGDPATGTVDFSAPVPAGGANNSNILWRYHWAGKLFDYLTVQAPTDDYLPNTDPLVYPSAIPVPITNSSSATLNAQTAGTSEDTVPVEGLININTAPWPVIASLPWFPNGYTDATYTGYNTAQLTQALAKAIVAYRLAPGSVPIKTLADLYRVTGSVRVYPVDVSTAETISFKQLADNMTVYAAGSAGHAIQAGDYSPYNGGAGGVDGGRYDFEKRFLLINRVSNLITTRSDAFTCYILLQGWSGAGTGSPTLIAQRRIAFIIDRSASTPLTRSSQIQNVPQN